MAFSQSWRAALKLSHVLDLATSGLAFEDTKHAIRFGHLAWVMLSDIADREADPHKYDEAMWDRHDAGMLTPSYDDASIRDLARNFIAPGRNDITNHATEMDNLMIPKLNRVGWQGADEFRFECDDAATINAAFAVAFKSLDAPWWIDGITMCIERFGDIAMAELAHPDPMGEMNAEWRRYLGVDADRALEASSV